MKKQLYRLKQVADQTFSRAGKTEALSDDLQGADRRVEVIRVACQNTSKKVASNLLAQGQDPATTREKRLKKSAEYLVGMSMLECVDRNDEESLLANIVMECGKLQMALANEVVDHDARLEEQVVNTLHSVSEGELPAIKKHKATLAKAVLDMDSARTRYQTAMKHSTGQGGTKVEAIREELEKAENEVDTCRDQLASEMFKLISREAELAQTVVKYAQLQKLYHEKAISVINNFLPELESVVNDSHIRRVFGVSLEDHLRVTSRKIAFPIELCVCCLLELGMEEDGILRQTGAASKVRRMKLSLDAGCLTYPTALEYRDPHVIAGVLKSYLRELPEPLMTYSLYDEWMTAARVSTSNDLRLQALWTVVQKLPEANRDNLRYLVKFLAVLCKNQELHRMGPQNVAIVMAPNLIWSPNCGQDAVSIGMNMSTANFCSVIVDSLVSFADWFFPGDIDFYLTLPKELGSELINGGSSSSHPGHVRHSSEDAQLVDTSAGSEMQRTQSNSSLSDLNNSPPQGSPKPATRHKKKPTAPTPPVSQTPANISSKTNTPATKFERPGKPPPPTTAPPISRPIEKPAKPPPPLVNQEKTSGNSNPTPKMAQPHKVAADSSIKASPADTKPVENQPTKSSTSNKIGFEHFITESAKTTGSPSIMHSSVCDTLVNTNMNDISSSNTSGLSNSSSVIMPQVSKSNSSNNPAVSIYGTTERKKPNRPTPVAAPRITLMQKADNHGPSADQAPLAKAEDEFLGVTLRRVGHDGAHPDLTHKPAIPERPVTLQRPLSSSFRMARPTSDPTATLIPVVTSSTVCDIASTQSSEIQNLSDSSEGQEAGLPDRGDGKEIVLVEDSVDNSSEDPLKRSESITKNNNSVATQNSAEKPERPPKPDVIEGGDPNRPSGGAQSTSQTAYSEAGECALPSNNQFGSLPRPPRPQPPLPQPFASDRPRSDSSAESTDL